MLPERLAVAAAAAALLALAGCPAKKKDDRTGEPAPPPVAADAAAAAGPVVVPPGGEVVLPPAPEAPTPPSGLPPLPSDHAPAPEEIALGELLFFDGRLAADGKTSCATCHDPDHGFAGTVPRSPSPSGKPNLRHTPTLLNLAWHPDLGWDGRGTDRAGFIAAHAAGQLGRPLADGIARLMASPTYRAHVKRTASGRDPGTTAAAALLAYAITRYSGGAPWDVHEREEEHAALPPEVEAGYKLFNGKAQCATCHAPPLYTDLGYHRLGLIASPDDGRGRVDPAWAGAFKTPTLRGVAVRAPLFHDGSAATLEAAVQWHLDGGRGQGADPSVVDPGLPVLALTADEQAALLAFVRALTPAGPPPARPVLPADLPAGGGR
ncbi:MAG TPA: cytochrome c peroxidase [Kofleriaceae bacterium]|nr:cytochrome c peroxidase [Kofleriaceae bacterium]